MANTKTLQADQSYNWRNCTSQTTNYTVLTTDDYVKMTGTYTVTLPAISSLTSGLKKDKTYKIEAVSGTVTIAPATGDTINDTTSYVLEVANDYVIIRPSANRTNWQIEYPAPSVNDESINNDQIVARHIAAGAIVTAGISDAQVTTAKISAAQVTDVKMSMANGTIVIGDATGAGRSAALSGDVTINNSGVAAIGTGKVLTAMISDNQITSAKISANQVLTAAISDGQVTQAKLANAVLSSMLSSMVSYCASAVTSHTSSSTH